ncbi:MAG: hypothetical protein ACHP65_07850 [Legionellales bacterium]
MPEFSNPFHEQKPTTEAVLIQESESFGTRLRDTLLAPLFYHTKKSFLVIALVCLLGLGMCLAPWFLPVALGVAIGLTILGGLVTLLTGLALFVNAHLFGWEDSSTDNEYAVVANEPVYNDNNELMGSATLSYHVADVANPDKKVPHLIIDAANHYNCGYVQGYKLADQGQQMLAKLKRIYSALRLLNGVGYKIPVWGDERMIQPFYAPLPDCLKEELNGVVSGHNKWAQANGQPDITLGDVMMLHMLPDIHNIKGMAVGGELLSSGCTAGVTKDANGGVVHFRNTDWASYNLAGRVSLFIERHIGNEEHSRTASFPLCVGAAYGENDKGLTLSINVSPGATVFNSKGKLAFLLYRELLKDCDSVAAVKERIKTDPKSQPIGPCQLTVSDAKDGAIIRFYQSCSKDDAVDGALSVESRAKDGYRFTHDISELSEDHSLLVVANEGLVKNAEGGYTRGNHHDSRQRIQNVHQVLAREGCARGVNDALTALRAPLVNNCESINTIIKQGSQTYFSASNGYSARFFPASVGAVSKPAVALAVVLPEVYAPVKAVA